MQTCRAKDSPSLERVAEHFAKETSGLLSERVYRAVRRSILVGDLPAGTRIRESELTGVMAVSRTPLREALRRLEAEGLVSTVPNRGVVVRGIDAETLIEIYETLAVLESYAVERAAAHISDGEIVELRQILDLISFFGGREQWDECIEQGVRFHRVLYAASRNAQLARLIESLRELVHSFRRFQLRDREVIARGYADHKAIVDALADRDGPTASRLMRDHINESIKLVQRAMSLRDECEK